MSIARKILWNTVSQIIGKATLAIIGLVTVKIITHYFGEASGYGDYRAVYGFISLFGIASDLGLYTIAVREMSKDERNIDKIIGNVLTVRTIMAIVVMLIAFITSFVIAKEDSSIIFPLAVSISAVATVLALLTGTLSSVLQVKYKMEHNAIASVLGKIASLSYMLYIIFVWEPTDKALGLYHLLGAGILGNLIMVSYTYYYARKLANIKYRFDKDFMKSVLIKSLPYGLALVLNNLYFRIGTLSLYVIKGEEQVGLYGVPMTILETIAILPLYFMNSVLPTLTRAVEGTKERYNKIIQLSFDALIMGGTSMAIGISVIAPEIIRLVSNENYMSNTSIGFIGSDIILQVLIFALAFSFLNTLFGFTLVAINKQSKLIYINGIGAIVAVISNIIIIPFLGAIGAAITDIIVEMTVTISAYIVLKKYLDFKISLKNTAKILFSGAVMGIVVYLLRAPTYNIVHSLNLLIIIPIGAIIYIGLILGLKVITKDMIKMIRKTDQKENPMMPEEI